jgi:hypothetical protein
LKFELRSRVAMTGLKHADWGQVLNLEFDNHKEFKIQDLTPVSFVDQRPVSIGALF